MMEIDKRVRLVGKLAQKELGSALKDALKTFINNKVKDDDSLGRPSSASADEDEEEEEFEEEQDKLLQELNKQNTKRQQSRTDGNKRNVDQEVQS